VEHVLADVLPGVDEDVRAFRTNELNKFREWRDAALFTYGVGLAQGTQVAYATEATDDYDFVTRSLEGTKVSFCPVQLKELVPANLNPTATLDGLLLGLKKYGRTQTVLAVLLNRRGQVNLRRAWPAVPFAQLWFFCATSPGADKWMISGDALSQVGMWEFDYPAPGEEDYAAVKELLAAAKKKLNGEQ
jgi:hypothetical protein